MKTHIDPKSLLLGMVAGVFIMMTVAAANSGPKRFQHQLITAGEHTTFNTALKNLDEHWECVAVAVHNGVIMGVVKREKE